MRVDGDLVPIPGYPEALSEEWVEKRRVRPHDRGAAPGVPGARRGRPRPRHCRHRTIPHQRLPPARVDRDRAALHPRPRVLARRARRAARSRATSRCCPRGLVLLTGPTGSGKSTTLTAMVDIINQLVPAHIITIEDPIEFHHESKRALIHQREVGTRHRIVRRGAAPRAAPGPRRRSSSASCATPSRSRPRCRRPRPATSCCRPCTRRARRRASTASSTCSPPTSSSRSARSWATRCRASSARR